MIARDCQRPRPTPPAHLDAVPVAGRLQRRASAAAPLAPAAAPPVVHEVLRSPGQPLEAKTRAFMEPRFGYDLSQIRPHATGSTHSGGDLKIGAVDDPAENAAEGVASRIAQISPDPGGLQHDFSRVRVHTGAKAAESAQAIGARAYAVGHDIVFNDGQYDPRSSGGRQLLAHELAHVVQQETEPQPGLVRRDPKTGDKEERVKRAAIDEMLKQIRADPHYAKLSTVPDKGETYSARDNADFIINTASGESLDKATYHLGRLRELLDTAEMREDEIASVYRDKVAKANKAEEKRLKDPAEKKKTSMEEDAFNDPKRKDYLKAIPGKYGGGTYYVDARSPTDIVVRLDILLTPEGKGTVDDVKAIKSLEDAIEKAASTEGYLVDVRFVDTAKSNTFQVKVDPSKKQNALNWGGSDPVGFAHEIHHLLAFTDDKYSYIDDQARNPKMKIASRLKWFRKELGKDPNYNNPNSIMAKAPHPDDADACTVAGFTGRAFDDCVKARVAAKAAKKP
jgi:Domain of unknown function (DUF4157)